MSRCCLRINELLQFLLIIIWIQREIYLAERKKFYIKETLKYRFINFIISKKKASISKSMSSKDNIEDNIDKIFDNVDYNKN